jgi:hypothetical protein
MKSVGDAIRRLGIDVRQGWVYSGQGKVLFLYGVGSPERSYARDKQTMMHRHTVIFDLGYYCRDAYMRMSITSDHPQQYLDLTPNAPHRWNTLGIQMTESYDPEGPIILVGMGRKTHAIQNVLRGASLVVCRHSNVAVDAVVAGVPFEAEDGAATWLKGKPYTIGNRLDFLRRLAYWQWHQGELYDAVQFAQSIIDKIPKPGRSA